MKVMKILKNSFDADVRFDNIEEAKRYYMPSMEGAEFEELDEHTKQLYKEYSQEIAEAESLEELAEVLNRNTDIFENGSSFSIKEI